MSAPFSLPLRATRLVWGLLGVGHVLPLLAVSARGVPQALQVLLPGLVAFSFVLACRRMLQARHQSLQVNAEGVLSLVQEGAQPCSLELVAPPRLLGPWVQLQVRPLEGGRTQSLLLWQSGQRPEDWRSLQRWVRLRGWQAALRAAGPSE